MNNIEQLFALKDAMNGRMYCSNINNPHAFVTVLNVVRASNGFSVLFSAGEGHAVFCGYKRFLKRFPNEVISFGDEPQTDTYRQIENDGWIEWGGGECPVVASAAVEVTLADGTVSSAWLANGWVWEHGRLSLGADIISYRVIENDGREG